VRRRERHAVVGPNGVGQAEVLEDALKHAEGVALLRGRQRFTGEQIPGGVVGDGERVAVALIAEQKFALVVGAPQPVRLIHRDERGAGEARPPAAAAMRDEAVPIEHRVNGADRGTGDVRPPLAQALADLGRAPRRAVPFQSHEERFDGRRQLIRVPIRPAAPVGETAHADLLVALKDLVAGLPGNAELLAEGRHRFSLQQSADESRALVHGVTLLPRHAPSW